MLLLEAEVGRSPKGGGCWTTPAPVVLALVPIDCSPLALVGLSWAESGARAITISTSPRDCCRIPIACWCVIAESNGCPSIARIWSPSCSRPSLHFSFHSRIQPEMGNKIQINYHVIPKIYKIHNTSFPIQIRANGLR